MDNRELLESFEEDMQAMKDEIDKITEEIKTYTQNKLKPIFSGFMEANPAVKAIFWTQYTPYWNDGEECFFSVNNICYDLGLMSEEDKDDSDFYQEGDYVTDKASMIESAEKALQDSIEFEKDAEAWREKRAVEIEKRSNFVPWVHGPYRFGNSSQQIDHATRERWKSTEYPDYETVEEATKYFEAVMLLPDGLDKITQNFSNVLSNIPDDVMQMIFGNHVKVIFSRDTMDFEIENYEHD